MKSKLRVTIVAAVAAQLIAILAYAGAVNATHDNNIARHADLSAPASCNGACHSISAGRYNATVNYVRVSGGLTRNATMLTAHGRHQASKLLRMSDTAGCKACHASSDLTGTNDTTTHARKDVDPTLCQRCHGAYVTSANPAATTLSRRGKTVGHETAATMKRGNCRTTDCHGGPGKTSTAAIRSLHVTAIAGGPLDGVINTDRTHVLCKRCHGGIQLFSAAETN